MAPHQLNRTSTGPKPETVYVGALPDLPPGEGWLYLAGVRDLCSRAVVGGAMADHRRAALVPRAWSLAIGQRQPAPGLIMQPQRRRP